MSSLNSASLINFLGFSLGAALYLIWLAVIARRPSLYSRKKDKKTIFQKENSRQAQINPNFLFNALTIICYLIDTAPKRALETLRQLTELLRGGLRSGSEFQTLGDELKLIRAYLEIERVRFEERLIIEIDVPENLLSFHVPSLILQPLVENAIKHGVSLKKEGGIIKIAAQCDAHSLILQIVDTGIGVNREELSKRRISRIGLNNIEQRLRLYFNNAANLTIDSRVGYGTTAEIRIDLKMFDSQAPLIPRPKIKQRALR
ncbi:MAG: histidine kinase [Actinomycetota bacterium]